MADQYLSTDPNAGTAPAPSGEYLSTDPKAGSPMTPLPQMNYAIVNGQRVPVDEHDSLLSQVIKLVGSAAPTVGGIVGGMAGGVPGAAVGGAAGAGYGELLKHATELPGAVADVARNLVTQPTATLRGAVQGAVEGTTNALKEAGLMAAGEGLGSAAVKGATGVSRFLMDQAAAPTMTLAREFPELSETLINNSLTVSKGGLAKARQLLSAAKAEANQALATAAQNGATVPITAATRGLNKTFQELAVNSSDPVAALNKLATIELRISRGRNTTLTMQEADALKTSLQTEARALYKQVAAGTASRNSAIEMVAKADMAQTLNAAIEEIATKAGASGYKASNAVAQDLIGATRAISRRLLQRGTGISGAVTEASIPATAGAVLAGPAGAATAAATRIGARAATNPSSLSRAAVYLSHPAVQAFVRQLPKPVLDALGSLFGGGEQP